MQCRSAKYDRYLPSEVWTIVNHQGNLLFVVTRDPPYLRMEDHVPDSTGAYSSDPLDRTARRVTCQLLQGSDDQVQRLGISRGDGVDLQAIVQ